MDKTSEIVTLNSPWLCQTGLLYRQISQKYISKYAFKYLHKLDLNFINQIQIKTTSKETRRIQYIKSATKLIINKSRPLFIHFALKRLKNYLAFTQMPNSIPSIKLQKGYLPKSVKIANFFLHGPKRQIALSKPSLLHVNLKPGTQYPSISIDSAFTQLTRLPKLQSCYIAFHQYDIEQIPKALQKLLKELTKLKRYPLLYLHVSNVELKILSEIKLAQAANQYPLEKIKVSLMRFGQIDFGIPYWFQNSDPFNVFTTTERGLELLDSVEFGFEYDRRMESSAALLKNLNSLQNLRYLILNLSFYSSDSKSQSLWENISFPPNLVSLELQITGSNFLKDAYPSQINTQNELEQALDRTLNESYGPCANLAAQIKNLTKLEKLNLKLFDHSYQSIKSPMIEYIFYLIGQSLSSTLKELRLRNFHYLPKYEVQQISLDMTKILASISHLKDLEVLNIQRSDIMFSDPKETEICFEKLKCMEIESKQKMVIDKNDEKYAMHVIESVLSKSKGIQSFELRSHPIQMKKLDKLLSNVGLSNLENLKVCCMNEDCDVELFKEVLGKLRKSRSLNNLYFSFKSFSNACFKYLGSLVKNDERIRKNTNFEIYTPEFDITLMI